MINREKIFLSVAIFLQLLFYHLSYSQNTNATFQHFSIESDLSDNAVNCIIQDARGFIWIGTDNGLNKFNGYKSKIFHHNERDSFSITSNKISCSFRDRTNRLWFGGNGLMVCNPADEKFISYKHEKNNQNGLSNNDVTAITQDENGIIWVGTRQGLFQFNEQTKKFIPFLHDTIGTILEVYRKNRVIEILPDMHGTLWISTITGLNKFSLSTLTFTTYLHDAKNKNSLTGNHISAFSFDKNGKLWLAAIDSGLCIFDTAKNQFEPVHFSIAGFQSASERVVDIHCDAKGKIWIATSYNGVLVFNPQTNNWQNYLHDIFDSKSLCDDKTLSLFEDNSGMIWIGTASRGVDRISPNEDKFISYTLQPGKPNSLCGNDITVACEDKKGNLWIGSINGLMYFDRRNNSFLCYKHDEKNSNSLSHNAVYSIAKDANENLWIATERGLNYFNPLTNKWKHYFNDEKNVNSLPGQIVFDVIVRNNGKVLAGTSSGIAQFKPDGETFINQFSNNKIEKLVRAYYNTLFEDSRHTLWISTARSGIYNLDDDFNILHSYRHTGGFNANTVHQFTEDNFGNIIMATDDGLYQWNKKTETISEFKSDEENLNGDIKSVVIANDKTIWISTMYGLSQLILKTENEIATVKNFNVSDGLQSNAFINCAGLKLKSGELFFGGINGFNLFKPENISCNNFIPPVQASAFKVFDKEITFQKHDSISEIYLDYKQNFFSFEMTAMSFDHPEKNQFAYQLEGFDKEMNYCGTNHVGSYTNIPPGDYSLRIIASNNDGTWNLTGTKINIHIIPPFWKTGWFRISIIIVLVLTAWLLYYLRIRKIKRNEEQRSKISRQIAEARLTALRAQMNPHFIFNSLNSIQHFISESKKDEALKYLSRFSKLIRLVLQNAERNTNTIADELTMLEFYLELESLRFTGRFTYRFDVDSNIKRVGTEIPNMLIQPFVENAVIHGLLNNDGQGHLEISMRKKDDKLLCFIEDNGIGRTMAAEIKNKKSVRNDSLGMKVTEERMRMIEKISDKKVNIIVHDLKDENGNAAGTKVEIEITIDE